MCFFFRPAGVYGLKPAPPGGYGFKPALNVGYGLQSATPTGGYGLQSAIPTGGYGLANHPYKPGVVLKGPEPTWSQPRPLKNFDKCKCAEKFNCQGLSYVSVFIFVVISIIEFIFILGTL